MLLLQQLENNVAPLSVDLVILEQFVMVPKPVLNVQICRSHQIEMSLVLPTPVNPVRIQNEL